MAYGFYQYPPYQTFQQYPQAPQQMPQQNGGIISVRSIEEAYNWPIAPGNSLMFKDENSPYVYTKTKGFSQLDQPVFEKYRLVKEGEPPQAPQQPVQARDYGGDIDALWAEVHTLQADLKALKVPEKPRRKKDEPEPDASV